MSSYDSHKQKRTLISNPYSMCTVYYLLLRDNRDNHLRMMNKEKIRAWKEAAEALCFDLKDMNSGNFEEMDQCCNLLGIINMLERIQGYIGRLNKSGNSNARPLQHQRAKGPLEVPFTSSKKKRLEIGDLASKSGGLLDCNSTKHDLYASLKL